MQKRKSLRLPSRTSNPTPLRAHDLTRPPAQPKEPPAKDDIFRHVCGSTSSKVPRLDMIPYGALVRLARRFELGAAKHGMDNYRQGLNDQAYVLERCAHVIHHALRLAGKLRGYLPPDAEDDAAAVAWGGTFLCESPLCVPEEPPK